ncbi:hypothetical protein BH10PSE17_BH10PSE17_23000 [soil metagenome]
MRTSRSIVPVLLSMLAALALSACSDSGKTAGQQLDSAVATAKVQTGKAMDTATVAVREAGSGLKNAADSTEKVMDDAAITASVKASIVKEPGLSATAIDVSTTKGVVTLKGNVDNEMSRKNAIQLATGTEGVRGVTDQLTVKKS